MEISFQHLTMAYLVTSNFQVEKKAKAAHRGVAQLASASALGAERLPSNTSTYLKDFSSHSGHGQCRDKKLNPHIEFSSLMSGRGLSREAGPGPVIFSLENKKTNKRGVYGERNRGAAKAWLLSGAQIYHHG